MKSIDPYQDKNQNQGTQGGREKTFSVIHVDRNAPEAICIDLVNAVNVNAANRAAKRKFPNSTILRIAENGDRDPTPAYPDARFIDGEFRPVARPPEPAWSDTLD